MADKELFIKCKCSGHGIYVSHYKWQDDNDDLFMNLFYMHRDNKPSLWRRIKKAWHMLFWKSAHIEEIIFTQEDAVELSKILDEFIEENNT